MTGVGSVRARVGTGEDVYAETSSLVARVARRRRFRAARFAASTDPGRVPQPVADLETSADIMRAPPRDRLQHSLRRQDPLGDVPR